MNILSTVKTHRTGFLFAVLVALTVMAFAAAVVIAWPALSYLVDSLLS